MVAAARTESGNLRYDVHRPKTNPGGVYALATWAEQGALDAHLASPPMRTLMTEQAAGDIIAPPVLTRTRMLSKPDGTRAARDRLPTRPHR